MKAKQVYELVQDSVQSYRYNYTYFSGNGVQKGSGDELYLLKKDMENIVSLSGGLDTNGQNFLNQCYSEISLNTCNGEDKVIEEIEHIKMSEINIVFCMKYGTDYVTEMTKECNVDN